jgi:NADH-quinone oxidoreductase subunit N
MMEDYRGLIYRSPLLGSVLIFFLISLTGIPFTGGFFGKFYAFTAAMQSGAVLLALIGLLNSGMAAAYYLRFAVIAARRPSSGVDESAPPVPQVGLAVGAALAFAVLSTLWLGIFPNGVLRLAQSGGHTLQAPAMQTEPPAAPTATAEANPAPAQ